MSDTKFVGLSIEVKGPDGPSKDRLIKLLGDFLDREIERDAEALKLARAILEAEAAQLSSS